MTESKPEPFVVAISDAAIEDLHARLRNARWSDDFANDDWRYGVNGAYLKELVTYWLDEFDWRAREEEINRFDHFRIDIDGLPIHFIQQRGLGPDPIPLILSHGWPWTFWDFHKVIGPLSDPAAFGGDPADAFDVIVPSLPGFGFSTPLTTAGVTFSKTADLWVHLMRDALGYERFAAQGGDWGALVTAQLGHKYPELLYGIHESLTGLLDFDYTALKEEDYSADEEGWFQRTQQQMATTVSHMTVHSTEPHALAYALDDSPLGMAAWMLQRRRHWSDCKGDVESVYSKDFLLTTFSLYWFTQSMGSSLRFYYENAHNPWQPSHDRQPTVETPAGFAVFPMDVLRLPRAIVAERTNLQHWTDMPRGGHFAPAEQPELLIDDVREFFRPLRG